MQHPEIAVDEDAQDVGLGELEERLGEEIDGGLPAVLDERIVCDVVRGDVLGEGLGEVPVDVEELDEGGEDSALGGGRGVPGGAVGFCAGCEVEEGG